MIWDLQSTSCVRALFVTHTHCIPHGTGLPRASNPSIAEGILPSHAEPNAANDSTYLRTICERSVTFAPPAGCLHVRPNG